jgi:hypothetical protein
MGAWIYRVYTNQVNRIAGCYFIVILSKKDVTNYDRREQL